MNDRLRYLVAFVVGCHGFIYIRFGIQVPGKVKEWLGSSWLLGGAITGDQLNALVLVLHVAAGIAILGCAAAIGLAPWAPGAWRPLAIVGALLGLVAFAVLWDGQVRLFVHEGGIGLVVSLSLLAGAIAFAAGFG